MILDEDYDIVTADNGKMGLTKIHSEKPDLIILDVMMTHMSEGLDIAKKLKEDKELKKIPVIMLTSVNEHFDYRSQIDDSYFPKDCWIDKPVKSEKLLNTIKKYLK